MEIALENVCDKIAEVLNENLEQIVFSNARKKEDCFKVKIRPILVKGELLFQETFYKGTQVFHTNNSGEEMLSKIREYLSGAFGQAQVETIDGSMVILVSKKGKISCKESRRDKKNATAWKEFDQTTGKKSDAGKESGRAAGKESTTQNGAYGLSLEEVAQDRLQKLSHDRIRQYILKDGIPVDFLVGLGVQTPDGKVTKNRYDKFRQINRYLEFIEDVLDKLPKDRTIRIIDFGCGKSYLTFAMYYYLHVLQKRDIEVTGLDLKKDVIKHCNELAESCGYEHLHFEVGDISRYQTKDAEREAKGLPLVDMVVSLHACDTATDYALEKAVKWGAQVIMAVPCCQHEVNRQIQCKELSPILQYGLLKERIAALVTDGVRARLLEEAGYDTQILEFIDMEHTPKNLLIRAVKRKGMRPVKKQQDVEGMMDFLHISPTLAGLLDRKGRTE